MECNAFFIFSFGKGKKCWPLRQSCSSVGIADADDDVDAVVVARNFGIRIHGWKINLKFLFRGQGHHAMEHIDTYTLYSVYKPVDVYIYIYVPVSTCI